MYKKIAKKVMATVAVAALAFAPMIASATTVSVSGGTWSYGVGSTVWSKYLHPSKIHGSSVVNGNGITDTDYNVAAGKTSSASTTAVSNKVDHAYYCVGAR